MNRFYEWHDSNGNTCKYFLDISGNVLYEWIPSIDRFVPNSAGTFIKVLGGDGVFYYIYADIREGVDRRIVLHER